MFLSLPLHKVLQCKELTNIMWKEMFFFSNNFEIEILRHSNFQSDAALHSNIIVSTEKNVAVQSKLLRQGLHLR